jgi:hypothetical protein
MDVTPLPDVVWVTQFVPPSVVFRIVRNSPAAYPVEASTGKQTE